MQQALHQMQLLESGGSFKEAAELLAAAMEAYKEEQDREGWGGEALKEEHAGGDGLGGEGLAGMGGSGGMGSSTTSTQGSGVHFRITDAFGVSRGRLDADGSVFGPNGDLLAYIEADGRVGTSEMSYVGQVRSSRQYVVGST